jgi:2-methylcitrate dehydratase PrpD
VVRDTLFKHHAACYLTHAAINAARRLAGQVGASQVAAVEVHVAPSSLAVCAIPEPATGLEAKFSLRATTAMALLGDDTTDAAAYSDRRARHPELVALRDRVTVVPDPDRIPTCAKVVVRTTGGDRIEAEDDTSRPATDLAAQGASLAAKHRALVGPALGRARADELAAAVTGLASLPSVRALTALVA